jgi:predicted TIM-barrel fold metal-dependent hydrolase
MLLDCNVHLGRWPFRRLPIEDVGALLRAMDQEGIDRALVAPMESIFLRDGQQGNEALHETASAHADRLSLLACLRPNAPGATDDLRKCREQWGSVGVRLHPNYHDCPLDDPATETLVAEAVELGMLVSVSMRMEDNRFQTSVGAVPDVPVGQITAFVEAWPDARLLIANLSRGEYPALAKSAAFRNGAVFVEHSELDGPYDPVRDLVDGVGADHAVFGSHTALRVTHRAVVDFDAAGLTADERTAMAEANALRLLGEA